MILFNDDNNDEATIVEENISQVTENVEEALDSADVTELNDVEVLLEDSEQTLKNEVDSLLEELNEIERSLGMQTEFDDIEFPEFKPIILPPIKYPEVESKISKADFAKLEDEQLDMIMRQLRKIDTMEAEVKAMKEVIDERLSVDFRAMYENIMEKTNIEAIKTYRNVQAVIIEENAKQNQALFGIDNKSNSLKKRMNNVLIFAIVSFVVSILVMLVTILPALGIKLF